MQTSKSRRPHSIKEFLSLLATTEKTEDKTILEENITSSIKNPVNAPTKAKPLPSQEIHWDTEDPSKLDLEWHNKIAMISKGVLCGSIFFILLAIMNFTEISGFIVSVPLLFSSIIGIKGGLGIKKRKPDSIFLCLIFSCISATVMLIDSALIISSGSFPGFINLALFTYSLACACAIFNSDDVKIVFPTEYRRITAIDKILAAISIITVLLLVGAAITYA